jgi:hypothetical protein
MSSTEHFLGVLSMQLSAHTYVSPKPKVNLATLASYKDILSLRSCENILIAHSKTQNTSLMLYLL